MERKLNKRQQLFVAEYLKSGNATAAYRVAYPGCKAPEVSGPRLKKLLELDTIQNLTRPNKAEHIEPTIVDHINNAIATAEEALAVRTKQMRANPIRFLNEFGQLDPKLMLEAGDSVIREFSYADGKYSIKINPQDAAADSLLKVHGKLRDSNSTTNNTLIAGEDALLAALEAIGARRLPPAV